MRLPALVTAFAALAAAAPASAETFIDVFAGRSFPQSTPLSLTADEARINGQVVPATLQIDIARVEPANATLYGGRAGHWFGRLFGVAVDIATLNPDVKQQTVTARANLEFDEAVFGERVTIAPGDAVSADIPRIGVPTTVTVAALAMVRAPIGATDARPGGRFAPYAFAGPVWVVTDSSLDGDLGFRAGGGARVALTRGLGLFAEYRYTRANADAVAGRFSGRTDGASGTTGDIRVDLRLRNHAAVGGVSLSF
ncbi:MAG: outer membrane beta-barrel protein [Sphingomonas fennica]